MLLIRFQIYRFPLVISSKTNLALNQLFFKHESECIKILTCIFADIQLNYPYHL
jgi:hypothetical protein